MTDGEISQKVQQTIAERGGDLNDPRMKDTLNNIKGIIRATAPSYTENDYMAMLQNNQDIKASNNPVYMQALQRFSDFNKFKAMNPDMIGSSLANGRLTMGSKTWNDLSNAGYGNILQNAVKLNGFKMSQQVVNT